MSDSLHLDPVARLNRDLRAGARTLGDHEVRFLVDAYYIMQEDRKRAKAQERALNSSAEPHDIITWLADQSTTLEKQIQISLDVYTRNHLMGSWMREIYGIGPVISAGLLAHIDITKAPTVGHIWQFAGIAGENQRPWEKGQKRPFNAKLKTLCWKTGQSFMKFSNQPECFYGHLYRERKEQYIAKNEARGFTDLAATRAPTVGKTTEAFKFYSQGLLPPGHIDAMARRYAVKIFLSHIHEVWYWRHHRVDPPKPFAISILGHAHYIAPPIPRDFGLET